MELSEEARAAYLHQLVTELATTELRLDALGVKALIKRSDELKKEILSLASPTAPTHEELILTGEQVEVTFTAVPELQVIHDKAKLKRALGAAQFDTLAQFSIKALEEFLNKEQLAQVTKKLPGTRRFKEARRIEP